jgi:hypothetical protein
MKPLLVVMLALLGLLVINLPVQAEVPVFRVDSLSIVQDKLKDYKLEGQKGYKPPFEIQQRTGNGNGGLKELQSPSMARLAAWQMTELSDRVSVPKKISSLSFLFSVRDAGTDRGLGVYFGSDLLWSAPGTLFRSGTLYAADLDLSAYAGQSGWLSVQLLGKDSSSAEYWIGTTFLDYAPAELGTLVGLPAIPEPSTWAMTGVGLLLVALQVRQKMKQRSGSCVG